MVKINNEEKKVDRKKITNKKVNFFNKQMINRSIKVSQDVSA